MPRLVEERWTGVGFDVVQEELPMGDDHGRPVHNADGTPKTEPHTTLVLMLPMPDGQRVVRVPFDEPARQRLLEKLTGGIVVPQGRVSI